MQCQLGWGDQYATETGDCGSDDSMPTWTACAMRLKSCQLAVISSRGLLHTEASPDSAGTAAACANSLLQEHPAAPCKCGRHQRRPWDDIDLLAFARVLRLLYCWQLEGFQRWLKSRHGTGLTIARQHEEDHPEEHS